MPTSNTWPGGITIETVTCMDSAGSCDSVVSMNSGFSDNSLEHLSAEEKACLMFLEETIESIETEEDSRLSDDEPDGMSAPSNVASKTAHLSASMGQNKLLDVSIHPSEGHSHLVPTPFIQAKGTSYIPPKARPGIAPDVDTFHHKPQATALDVRLCQDHHSRVPPEVNVVVIPPPSKPKDYSGQWPPPSSRGPLSYDALVQLRKSASLKRPPKNPPDATRDSNRQPSAPVVPVEVHCGSTPRGPVATTAQGTHLQACPPVVFPKPPTIPTHIALSTQKDTADSTTDPLPSDRCLSDPQKVRKEALQKLGLLKDYNAFQPVTPPWSSKSHSTWDLHSSNCGVKAPAYGKPKISQPSTTSQGTREPNGRPLQSSSSFVHRSWSEEQPAVPELHLAKVKAATLEHSGVGLGSSMANHRKPLQDRCCTPVAHIKIPEQEKTHAAQPVSPHKTQQYQGFSVVMVPNMGEDRREALRKLGLLKE
ncbi:specifically androgen-regulated gene protein [Esox lucius]|uniref:Specifically androgen-regulated gene protein n=1 Tax=Esox lucius TaxID=8010 RepID=A0A3P8ZSY8_ESOLU|nr:specifically androgen-regulated gene protein [Esox lucius]XP_019910917.2 specifically androgen-regulated gene protein [Esox lucius]XP_034143009.1 specifically androgen-regulated gene protein [Esox lucius]